MDLDLVAAKIHAVYLHPTQRVPIVFVISDDGSVVIPMVIGFLEAQAILSVWQGVLMPRPVTADLLHTLITKDFSASVEKVILSDVQGGAYIAEIIINSKGKTIARDCRPSDALAIALRAKAPIFMTHGLIEKTEHEHTNTRAMLEFLEAEAEDSDEIIKF